MRFCLSKKAKARGITCILATNPLFPQNCEHGNVLNWAGLHTDDFALITSYENSYAAKPNLKYYRDILEFINMPAESCLMVERSGLGYGCRRIRHANIPRPWSEYGYHRSHATRLPPKEHWPICTPCCKSVTLNHKLAGSHWRVCNSNDMSSALF